MIKNKKIIIAILVLIVVIVIGIIVFLCIKINNQIVNEKKLDNRIQELFENSYKYYCFSEGNITITDGTVTVENETYNYVDDEYKSIDSIMSLINNTFVPEKVDYYIEKLNEKNKYLQVGDNLYVKKISNSNGCKIENNINYNSIIVEDVDNETKMLKWDDSFTYIYLVDNEWFLGTEIFNCIDDSEVNEFVEE